MAIMMNPGGRKFLDFINPLVRFVARKAIGISTVPPSTTRLPILQTTAMLEVRDLYRKIDGDVRRAQDTVSAMASLMEAQKQRRTALEVENSALRSEMRRHLENSRHFEFSRQNFDVKNEKLNRFRDEASPDFKTVLQALEELSGSGKRPELVLTGDGELSETFSKLLASVDDAYAVHPAVLPPETASKAAKAADFVLKYKDKFYNQQLDLECRIPRLNAGIEEFEASQDNGDVGLWQIWAENDPEAALDPDDVAFESILSDFGLTEPEIIRKDKIYRRKHSENSVEDDDVFEDVPVLSQAPPTPLAPAVKQFHLSPAFCDSSPENRALDKPAKPFNRRRSALVMQKRLSELTKSMGDQNDFLLCDEPDITQNLDISLDL